MSALSPLTSPGSGRRRGLDELVLEVAASSVTERDTETLLREVCARLTQLCGLTGAAAVLFDGSTGSVRTVVASHPEAEQLTRLVQQLGLGVSSGAIRAGQDSAVEDLTESVRAGLADAAARVGLPVTAVLALRTGEKLVGCMQLFSRTPDTFTTGLLDELAPLSRVLGATLGNLEAYRHTASLVASLTAALDRQVPIEQAKGMLAERHRVDLDAAYRMLREQARRRGTTVATVATEVVSECWRVAGPPVDWAAIAVADEPPAPPGAPERPEEPRSPNDTRAADQPATAEPVTSQREPAQPAEQVALLDVPTGTTAGRSSSRVPAPKRTRDAESGVPEQTSLLDLAATSEQAALPEQRGGRAEAEVHP